MTSKWSWGKQLNIIAEGAVTASLAAACRPPRWRLITGMADANLVLFGRAGWCPTRLSSRRLGARPASETASQS